MENRFPYGTDLRPHGLFLTALLWLVSAVSSSAIPASPRPLIFTQPDGTRVALRQRGDEFLHWREDTNGFTVVRDGDRFVYAKLDVTQRLAPTAWQVGKVDPAGMGLTPHLLPPQQLRPANLTDNATPYRPWAAAKSGRSLMDIGASGTVKNLVVLCRFSDSPDWNCPAPEDFNVLYNQVGGDPILAPTGSVKDAYRENSYNIVTIQSTVLAWVKLPQTRAYYAGPNDDDGMGTYPNNAQKMVEEALDLVDPMVNFADFDTDNDGYVDAIDFIHAGHGAEAGNVDGLIWSHQWKLLAPWVSADNNAIYTKVKVQKYHTEAALYGDSSSDIARIGVICHETGHYFGLPDLYDTEKNATSSGVGAWCMMANSWGIDGTQLRPPHFSAWCKIFLGWTVPGLPVSAGTYSLAQTETTPAAIKITRGFPAGEYLLIENRQPVGLDADIPQGGLAIWHIDESVANNETEGYPGQAGWPQNGKHYKVALLQADGLYQLERGSKNANYTNMLYCAGTNNLITAKTVPSTDAYQGGNVYSTFNLISKISAPAATMYLDYSFYAHVLYVDKFYAGPVFSGTWNAPYKSVTDAYNAAVDGDTIAIRAADYTEAPLHMHKKINFDTFLGPASVR